MIHVHFISLKRNDKDAICILEQEQCIITENSVTLTGVLRKEWFPIQKYEILVIKQDIFLVKMKILHCVLTGSENDDIFQIKIEGEPCDSITDTNIYQKYLTCLSHE